MFQKLYRLLEDIDRNTRQQTIEAGRTRNIINELGKEMAVRNQLEDHRREVTVAAPLPTPIRSFAKVNLVLACLGIIALCIFSYSSYRFFASTQQLLQRSEESVNEENYSDTRYIDLKMRQGAMAAEVTRLDSLIQQERLSLMELKKLNETAVKTFVRIRRDLARREQKEAGQVRP